MDLAMALAEEVDADLVVANDPDADRCAVALPGRTAGRCCAATRSAPCWPTTCSACAARASTPPRSSPPRCWARWPRRAAAVRRDAHRLQVDRPRARTWPSATRRRSATASTRPTCATRTASRRCCWSATSPPARRQPAAPCATCSTTSPATHGLHATDQLSVRMDDLAAIPAVVDRLRDHPPTSLGGLAVERVDDLSAGLGRPAAHQRPALPPRGRRPGRRTPVGHRAEDQVLPRGRRARRATTTRTASTPPGSPPSAASTPSAATCRPPPGSS